MRVPSSTTTGTPWDLAVRLCRVFATDAFWQKSTYDDSHVFLVRIPPSAVTGSPAPLRVARSTVVFLVATLR